jgi:hypothetical protein
LVVSRHVLPGPWLSLEDQQLEVGCRGIESVCAAAQMLVDQAAMEDYFGCECSKIVHT